MQAWSFKRRWQGSGLAGALGALLCPLTLAQTQTTASAFAPVKASAPAAAVTGPRIGLSGLVGDKALLVINGSLRSMSVGSTYLGVKLLGIESSGATVEVEGKRMRLALGSAPVRLGGDAQSSASDARIVLSSDAGGHFFARGSINGHATQFMVDTGATSVVLGRSEAERMGINYMNGVVGQARTANGVVQIFHIKLDTVRIGDVQVFNVDAAVNSADMNVVLLGNSFLKRFHMKRENNMLTLEKVR